jgi:hypothetical protein
VPTVLTRVSKNDFQKCLKARRQWTANIKLNRKCAECDNTACLCTTVLPASKECPYPRCYILKFRPWVSNSWPARVCCAACSHICKSYVYCTDCTIIWEVGYTTYCDFYTWPANQPHNNSCGPLPEKVWHPWFRLLTFIILRDHMLVSKIYWQRA